MPKVHHARGHVTTTDRYQSDYRRRGTRQEQGYTNEWLARARDYRKRNPLCVKCTQRGKVTPCQCVDHIVPHRGDPVLFWDENNWQSLCNPCHNGPKRREEEAARRAARDRARPGGGGSLGRGGAKSEASAQEARIVAKKGARELKIGGISAIRHREGF